MTTTLNLAEGPLYDEETDINGLPLLEKYTSRKDSLHYYRALRKYPLADELDRKGFALQENE